MRAKWYADASVVLASLYMAAIFIAAMLTSR